jgi:diguanylate cyclase (GGDEF)-like protein
VSARPVRWAVGAVGGRGIQEQSLRTVIRENVDGMLVIDREGIVLFANPAAERLLGRPAQALESTRLGFPLVPGEASEIDVVAEGEPRTAEMRVVEIDWKGRRAFLASLRDVTGRKRAESLLERRAAQQAAIARLGGEAMSGLAPEVVMAEAANEVREVLSVDFSGVLELVPDVSELRLVASDRSPGTAGAPAMATARPSSQPGYTLVAGEPVVMENAFGEARFRAWPPLPDSGVASAATVVMKDRERHFGVVEAASRSPRRFDTDEVTFLQSVADLLASSIARSRAEASVRHQALHDPLTGLPNRVLFLDRLAHALARAKRQKTKLAVLFADLDGFKRINDSLGHHAGDEVLVSLAARLTDVLRSSDSVARFGGDEFIMVLEDIDGAQDALRVVRRVKETLAAAPFMVEGQPHALDVTIGIVLADESHERPGDLVRDADAAMYRAKELGRGGHAVFDRQMREHVVKRLRLEKELHRALDDRELRLLYQPIVSLDSGEVIEFEALLRWQHPERGLLGPADFLDVAVETGLIVPIGKWVLPEACRQAAGWPGPGVGDTAPSLSVNMAPLELAQPELTETVSAAIAQGGVGLRLQLELTEGALIEDPHLPATLAALRSRLGVRVALDDFGTGYSSLGYLTRFPIDELKIDQSFVRALQSNGDAPIVAAMASMAHALGIAVVAEGIESQEQAIEARRLGCDRGQGFFFARPLPADEIPALLASRTLPAGPRSTSAINGGTS